MRFVLTQRAQDQQLFKLQPEPLQVAMPPFWHSTLQVLPLLQLTVHVELASHTTSQSVSQLTVQVESASQSAEQFPPPAAHV